MEHPTPRTDAEPRGDATAQPTDPAPSASPARHYDPDLLDRALGGGSRSDDDGALNSGRREQSPRAEDPDAGSAAKDATSDAASKGTGAPRSEESAHPAEGAPEPSVSADDAQSDEKKPKDTRPPAQPGSRRANVTEEKQREIDDLNARVEQVLAERERLAREKADREAREAQAKAEAKAEAEAVLGKPGELADLQQKWANNSLSFEEEERLRELTRMHALYEPLKQRAEQAGLAKGQEVATQQVNAVLGAFAQQLESAASEMPDLDPDVLKSEGNLTSLLRHAREVGAASRDAEITERDDKIADLEARLAEAQTRAFTSQPPLARGGVSGSGVRGPGSGFDPNRDPRQNLDAALAGTANGRR